MLELAFKTFPMSKLRPLAVLVVVGIMCQSLFLLQFRDGDDEDPIISPTYTQQVYYKKSDTDAISNPNLIQQTLKDNEMFNPIDRPMAARDIFTMPPLEVCGRMAAIPPEQEQQTINKYTNQCPTVVTYDDPIFLIEGQDPFGRTGNKLLGFLHALEKARKTGRIVGIVVDDSWALPVITTFFMSIQDGDVDEWKHQMEKTFCIKLLTREELPKYTDVVRRSAKDIFIYTGDSDDDLEEYIEFQTYHIRNLFRHYNNGDGVNSEKKKVRNMCISLDEMFGSDRSCVYSVIHSRSFNSRPLERKSGMQQLGRICAKSGCDPIAALDMQPEYVKSILRPLGMLEHPIVIISDGQDLSVAERLLNDPEIAPMLRLVPNRAKWIGGDITLAIMSTTFIGNPASTFSGFIAKSRLALGLDNTFMFRARNENGEWDNTCGDTCIFSKRIMRSNA
ncbi:hypothetical protein QTG54_007550 [Skeletonema marinoi]|uniref:Uncharacterized protein n=1 Tax=Skeletonema marinoi TaxID=267567 RepID=A0AAD8Y9F5_9STRA|nr:hypothetical protein QTG54_007550 [Skeletonema marinoi]